MIHILLLLVLLTVFSECSPQRGKNPEEAGYFEGDMILPDPNVPEQRSAIRGNFRWPNGVIPVVVDARFTFQERLILRSAVQEISTKTCIRFVTRTTERDYVFINRGFPNSGCFAHLGRIGGRQIVNLQPPSREFGTCIFKGIIEHELVHAIGFVHEQSRTDRDNFVTINFSNIPIELVSNFEKYSSLQVDDLGLPYDFNSLMHYGAFDFAINPQ